jgi:serine phosphatase RsbU (regulator of sigma subunit)
MIRAGHPHPVLIDGTSVSRVSEEFGAVGIGVGRGGWQPERIPLPPGWTILLYTDGIVDGRVGSGAERLGEDGLHELVAEAIERRPGWRGEPRELLDELIETAERLNGEALSDDVAMLLVGECVDGEPRE